jgi:hypothetical protein
MHPDVFKRRGRGGRGVKSGRNRDSGYALRWGGQEQLPDAGPGAIASQRTCRYLLGARLGGRRAKAAATVAAIATPGRAVRGAAPSTSSPSSAILGFLLWKHRRRIRLGVRVSLKGWTRPPRGRARALSCGRRALPCGRRGAPPWSTCNRMARRCRGSPPRQFWASSLVHAAYFMASIR